MSKPKALALFALSLAQGLTSSAASAQTCQVYDQRTALTWSVSLNAQNARLEASGFPYDLPFDSTKFNGARVYSDGTLCLTQYTDGSVDLLACHNSIFYFKTNSCGVTPTAPVVNPPPVFNPPPMRDPSYPGTCQQVTEGVYNTQLSAFDLVECPSARLEVNEATGQVSYQLMGNDRQRCLVQGTTRIFDCRRRDNAGFCPEITGARLKINLLSEDTFLTSDGSNNRTWVLASRGSTKGLNCTSQRLNDGYFATGAGDRDPMRCPFAKVTTDPTRGIVSYTMVDSTQSHCVFEVNQTRTFDCRAGGDSCREINGRGSLRIINDKTAVVSSDGTSRTFSFHSPF